MATTPDTKDKSAAPSAAEKPELTAAQVKTLTRIADQGESLTDELALCRSEIRKAGGDDYAAAKWYKIPEGLIAGSNPKVPFAAQAMKLTKAEAKRKGAKAPTVPNFALLGSSNNFRDALKLAKFKDPSNVKGPKDLTPTKALEMLKLVKAGKLAPKPKTKPSATDLELCKTAIANHGDGDSEEEWCLVELAQRWIDERD